jgi:hypothetical protein
LHTGDTLLEILHFFNLMNGFFDTGLPESTCQHGIHANFSPSKNNVTCSKSNFLTLSLTRSAKEEVPLIMVTMRDPSDFNLESLGL